MTLVYSPCLDWRDVLAVRRASSGLTRKSDQSRQVGERWQGPSGRWFTKLQSGHVVPAPAQGSQGAAQPAKPAPASKPAKKQWPALEPWEVDELSDEDHADYLASRREQTSGKPAAAKAPEPAAKTEQKPSQVLREQPKELPHAEKVGAGARPVLTEDEKIAVNWFTGSGFHEVNSHLRQGKPLGAEAEKHQRALQAAFARIKPLEKPVPVIRAMNMEWEPYKEFDAMAQRAIREGGVMRMKGYSSTTTSENKKAVTGNVFLHIEATLGLDAQPYSDVPLEDELILPDNAAVTVSRTELDSDGMRHYWMRQVLEGEGKRP